MSIAAVRDWRRAISERRHKLVLTNGCFDILHRGHAEYLYRARQYGDALLVAVNSDQSVVKLKGPSRPLTSEDDRAYLLSSLEYVDAVVIFTEKRVTGILRATLPDVYVKGGDYTEETLNPEERDLLHSIGSKIVIIPYLTGYSTSGLIAKIGSANLNDS